MRNCLKVAEICCVVPMPVWKGCNAPVLLNRIRNKIIGSQGEKIEGPGKNLVAKGFCRRFSLRNGADSQIRIIFAGL